MTTYKEIYGTNVEVLSSDPTNPVEGQIWYNSTSQTLKGYALVAGSWATATPLNTARNAASASGTKTAALTFGGSTGPTKLGNTESYNGTSWTELNDLNTARRVLGGAGLTNTAALAFGGNAAPGNVANTETWNGTSWTEVNDLNTARTGLAGSGTNTVGLAFGGATPTATGATEEWNAPGTATETITLTY